MKSRFTALAGALLGLMLSAPVSSLPQHGETGDFQSEPCLAHRDSVDPAASRKAHLHTINARHNDMGRLEAAPPAGVGRQLTVHSTAYCLRGLTARGTSVNYGTIAVDPRVIPMGSKIYIPGYGWGRALDTGGAIRGNIIDLWFPTSGQCFQWGTRKVTITVMPKD